MIILTIRTDKPEAELGLYDDQNQLAYKAWQAHRQLAETIHITINKIVESNKKNLKDIEGIVCYEGPGSFTGLRIGLTVGNALAEGLNVPIVASESGDWIKNGIDRLLQGEDDHVALPKYGAPVHITQQKK